VPLLCQILRKLKPNGLYHARDENILPRFFRNLAVRIGGQSKKTMGQTVRRRSFSMDPGRVVWLPGGGFNEDYDAACQQQYGADYYACDVQPDYGGVWVYCCPY